MTSPREPIAIIGIGCRFPGRSDGPAAFWDLLERGGDAISQVPADRWDPRSFYSPEPGAPGRSQSRWGGFLDGIDRFDPQFFGISPREAARMDPQQRLLMEVAWEALEDGGQVLDRLTGGRTAVFVGIASWDYSVLQTDFRDRSAIDVYSNTGGSLSIAANRISYCFDFRGPSAAVDTACSSSMLAVHLACRSLWEDRCPTALAGGVNALLLPDWFVGFSRLGMLSPDGRCRAFDATANGYVRSEGAGVVVLKPLARALADGDRVYAVIRGTAVNQDGRTPGMTVPSREAQEELIRRACRDAGVDPSTIQYAEAHGTGTPVGDPIEAGALGSVLGVGRPEDRPCLVGSVKTNIGHLEPASGIAGLIKTALALHHRRVPGNLHFRRPNPAIDFTGLRLRVPVATEAWPEGEGPARADVNSFGYGGTNVNVVLEEAPAPAPSRNGKASSSGKASSNGRAHVPTPFPLLVPLSARSPEALRASAEALAQFAVEAPGDVSLGDIAWNAATRRTHHEHRLAVVASTREGLAELLAARAAGRPAAAAVEGRARSAAPKLAFVCSGQGPQWWAMGRQLLEREPVFRAMIERCDAIVRRLGPWSLLDELTKDESASRMAVTAISQPAIFALQVGLAALWQSWGVRPSAVLGHSVGEVAAAYLAGVFDLDDAVRVIYERGRCMELAPSRGRMLAADVAFTEARELVAPYGDRVGVAAVNAPRSVTLSGEGEPLEEIARSLEARGVFCRFLQVQYAFHSAQMDPIRGELLASLDGLRPGAATLPFVSTVTGERVLGPELGAEYWWRNVREMVRFAEGAARLAGAGCDAVIELGPHPVLAKAVAEVYRELGREVTLLPSLRRLEDERATMLRSVGVLHTLGHPVEWPAVIPGAQRPVRLPGYPWQHRRYWFEAEESRATRLTPPAHPLLGQPLRGPRPCWEARLDLRNDPYLADHRVQGAVIAPASAFVEAALAVGREVHGAEVCQLDDLKLTGPCFPSPEEPVRLHADFDGGDSTVTIYGRGANADRDWSAHARATIRPSGPEAEPRALTPDEVRARCPRAFSAEEAYAYFKRLGLDYGPCFQGIERGWQGDREALALVRLPEGVAGAREDYLLHPALLDACFQVGIPADPDFNAVVDGLYLPAEIERVRFRGRPGPRVWCHARLREKTLSTSVTDLDIYDEQGQPVAAIRGLRSRRVAETERSSGVDGLLYGYRWQLRPLTRTGAGPVEPPADIPAEPGRWLIFADRGGAGDWLAGRLAASGEVCILASGGPGYAEQGEGRVAVDPGRADDMVRLLREVASDPRPLRGIVHLWNLDAPAAEGLETAELDAAQDRGLLSVLSLVQAWDKVGGDGAPRLFLVTRGAQSVGEAPEAASVAQAPLIGLGRVIVGESPRLRTRLVDLDPAAVEAGLEALLDELRAEDDEDEVAFRAGERHVHRYGPTDGRAPSWAISGPEASYRLEVPAPGTLEALTYRAAPRTAPGPGEVEIEVVAAGLNFSDVMKAMGLYPGLPDGPVALGAECSGRISAVGDGVDDWREGDEVMAVGPFAFGSHVRTRADLVARKPSALSFEEAAGVPITFLTAAHALEELGRIRAGETVLIHSAAGGVGLAAVQVARRAGAEVFATAGTAEKRELLEGLGIGAVMDSRSLAFADEVLERTGGRGVDLILNSLAGEAIVRGLEILAEYGRFLEIGKRDIYQNARVGLAPFRKSLAFFAIDLDRMMRERPEALGRLLGRLAGELEAGTLAPLPVRVFPAGEAAEAFRVMQQGRHVGKLVLSMRERPAAIAPRDDLPVAFRADATYLIAGGLGGFGLEVARWMTTRGATHLVLAGRRGLETPGAGPAVAELEALGARVTVARADIADPADVARLLAEVGQTLPPLRGVVHAAMVLEDSTLLNLDPGLMRRALEPKMSGAWNLHRQTERLELDHFILFSSLSSVFGHAGQGNYAAANAFLDALAHYRRARGLPALTINWGYLGEVGYLARREQLGARLERQGVHSFTVREALEGLERAMQRRAVQLSVMRIDWSRWRGLGVTGRVSPRFAHLLRQAEAPAEGPGGRATTARARVLEAPADGRRLVLVRLLQEKLARVLGTASEALDPEKPLLDLGLDSLIAVELRNWIDGELRVNLPIVELMRSPRLSGLADRLLGALANPEDDPAPSLGRPAAADSSDDDPAAALFPLAHGQRGLWFLHQADPTGASCNLASACRIRSPLDLGAFRRAVQGLARRHPALRTTIEVRDHGLLQRVRNDVGDWLTVVDASSWGDDELRRQIEDEAHRPFDLGRGPLFRLALYMRSTDDCVLLLAAHHLVGDFWSLVLILEEMRTLYPAERDGTAPALSAPAATFRDFVAWQAAKLAGPDGERDRSYWEAQLAGVPPVLDLPTDRRRPPAFTHRGAAVPCAIEAPLTSRLKALAADEQVTLYTVLLAGFQALLGRYSGQDDLVVGSPFAGRSRPEFEAVVGDFINMLPMRADLSGDPSFRELVRRAGATVSEALLHQDYPFPLIVEGLDLPRDPSRTPLVQATLTLERAQRSSEVGAWRLFFAPDGQGREIGGLSIEPFPIASHTCQTDLELVIEEAGGTVGGMLRYNADLFDAETIRGRTGQLLHLLNAVADDPDRKLSALPWAVVARHSDVGPLDDPAASPCADVCLHQLFERQARKTPEAVAVQLGARTLRYGELDAWANRIAHRLRRAGVGPEVPVALCLERSPEMIAAILGTLKAGGAYVPLDPASPPERLRMLLSETQAPVLLAQAHLVEALPQTGATVIGLGPEHSFAEEEETDAARPPESGVAPGDLAYVIYTSGSTGRPKGVMVEHRAIVNTVRWRQRDLTIGEEDRVLLIVPYVFDPSLCVIFPTLAVGARLVLADPGEERDPDRLLERIAGRGVTVLQVPPRGLEMLLDRPAFRACRSLRWVCCGGEAMPVDLPGRVFERLGVALYNLYGPTETAVDATCWACRPGEAPGARIPIGRPIAGASAHVLDDGMRPLPPGVPGELFLGGRGLARGYLADPRLTAERFLPDPFAREAGARLYRTGDRCRWRADGSLEFLGRLDQQVELRGYRIEPAEIESALACAPGVGEACVVLRDDGPAGPRLVAYLAPSVGAEDPSPEAIRDHLRRTLPEYMVPSAFVVLPELPRTASGKVDRRGLPAVSEGATRGGRPFEAPRTPLEEFLAALWREVLGAQRVGIHDDFFALGGSSIQAAMVTGTLREALGEPVSTILLFDLPTVAGLARHLGEVYPAAINRRFGLAARPAGVPADGAAGREDSGGDRQAPNALLVALGPDEAPGSDRGRKRHASPLFLVHPPGGIVVCYRALARHLGRERPILGIRARGLHGERELPGSLEEMAAEYVAAVRSAQPEGPYYLGGWSLGGVVALEIAQQLLAQGQQIGRLIFLDTTIPFGPANRHLAEDPAEAGREYGLDVGLEELAGMDSDEQLPYLWQHVRKLGLVEDDTPMPLVRQILDDLKRLFHAHVRLAGAYAIRPYPGRITLFRANDAPVSVQRQVDRGWGQVAADVDVHFVPGQHHTMVKEPHVRGLAQALRACLPAAEPRARGTRRRGQRAR